MPDYNVQVPFTGYFNISVEANNEESAIEKALNDVEFMLNVEAKNNDVELGEWECHQKIVKGNVFYGVLNEIEAEEV